jgi:hypothetical protein
LGHGPDAFANPFGLEHSRASTAGGHRPKQRGRLADINPSGGSFRVVLYVWFNDPAGRFNVERDLHLVARTASIDAIDTEPAPGGGSYTYARIEAEVPQEFDYRDFPFDRQRLTVRMEASETVEELHFVPDHEDTDASDYLPLLGWTLDGVSIDAQEHAYDSDFGYWTGRGVGDSQIQLSLHISRDRSPVLIDDFLGFVFALHDHEPELPRLRDRAGAASA